MRPYLRRGSPRRFPRPLPSAWPCSTVSRSPTGCGAAARTGAASCLCTAARLTPAGGIILARCLSVDRRVIAIDLSGHGDSGRRESYSFDGWAREILAVAADAGLDAPTVIGHDMGGVVTLRLAALFGSRIEGAVVIDSPVRNPAPEQHAAQDRRVFRELRVYPSREAAIARFPPGSRISRCLGTSRITSPPRRSARLTAGGRGSGTRGSSSWSRPGQPAYPAGLPGGAVPGRARHHVRGDQRDHV